MKLWEVVTRQANAHSTLRDLIEDFERKKVALQAEIAEYDRLREAAINGVDLEKLALAETVIYWRGDPLVQLLAAFENQYDTRLNGPPRIRAIEGAILDLATTGGHRLRQEYFGVKNYDHFGDQRCDGPYGTGPRHGTIVFAVGMTREARQRPLIREEVEAAVYLLEQLKAGKLELHAAKGTGE